MSASLGQRAIIIGAGMSGLGAAAALSERFERVIVLERDTLSSGAYSSAASVRPGTPQAAHSHLLLFGGLLALSDLFPGFDRDLGDAGAVPYGNAAMRQEFWGFDPYFPRRDFEWIGFAMSRPLLELVTRRRAQQLSNVELRERCRVTQIIAADDGSVAGVKYQNDEIEMTLSAAIVVDASARGVLAFDFLKGTSQQQPEVTRIGIDVNYATVTFEIPKGERDWQVALTFPDPKSGTRAGYLSPIEGDRWMVLLSERHIDPPPPDLAHFFERVESLRTPTLFNAIKDATPVGQVHRFGFPEKLWRHYERLDELPTGLLVIGDAICRLNPALGHGMAVAAHEAKSLRNLLREWDGVEKKSVLAGLGSAFMKAVFPLVQGAWSQLAVPDLAHPLARGERPPDLENSLRFSAALMRVAASDPKIHGLTVAVHHLIEPASVLRDPEIVRRVEAEIAQAM